MRRANRERRNCFQYENEHPSFLYSAILVVSTRPRGIDLGNSTYESETLQPIFHSGQLLLHVDIFSLVKFKIKDLLTRYH